jgi:hypothetical protein
LEASSGGSAGLPASVITRLIQQWQAKREAFLQPIRPAGTKRTAGLWDPLQPVAGHEPLCRSVIEGLPTDGSRKLVAVAGVERESAHAGAEVLRDCGHRHLGASAVTVGDGESGDVAGAAGIVQAEDRVAAERAVQALVSDYESTFLLCGSAPEPPRARQQADRITGGADPRDLTIPHARACPDAVT